MSRHKLLVYLLRRDLRVSDNPILHHLATDKSHGYTHLLPIYVIPPNQIEVSGFLEEGQKSPYPPAKSQVGKFWRCGPHRANFIAESVWDLKRNLESIESGLLIRVGTAKDVLNHLLHELKENGPTPSAVWMTQEHSWEEVEEERAVATVCSDKGIEFKSWHDEKYFIDDRDTALKKPGDLPDVFTSYRKSQEPLREKPRKSLPRPSKGSLPLYPNEKSTPSQNHPFICPASLEDFKARLTQPLSNVLPNALPFPEDAKKLYKPLGGGETAAWERLHHLGRSGAMTAYKDTRNGLLGQDYSTKLSCYLALGSVTARQVHEELVKLEDGSCDEYKDASGYGEGENDGTRGIRFELLWRDYMRLCTAKFGRKLFSVSGFQKGGESYDKKWKTLDDHTASPEQSPSPAELSKIMERFQNGTTGMGIIDASQRELFHTGYTSNRARQNAASFFSKHLGIDWRYGAEWYEMLLVDYDVSSNWANWQYVAGVGNDPRGDARTFNPVKQAFDYDKEGLFVRTWVPELKDLQKLENLFQPWTTEAADLESCNLRDNIMVTDPVKRIDFYVDRKPRPARRPFSRKRGQGRGGRWGAGASSGHRPDGSRGTDLSSSNGSVSSTQQMDTAQQNYPVADGSSMRNNGGSVWRGNQVGNNSQPAHGRQPGRGWYGGDFAPGPGRGGNGVPNRGNWRPYTQRGGNFRGRYYPGYGPPVSYPPYPPGSQ